MDGPLHGYLQIVLVHQYVVMDLLEVIKNAMMVMLLMGMDVPLPVEVKLVILLVHVMDGHYRRIMEFAQRFVETDF